MAHTIEAFSYYSHIAVRKKKLGFEFLLSYSREQRREYKCYVSSALENIKPKTIHIELDKSYLGMYVLQCQSYYDEMTGTTLVDVAIILFFLSY